MTEETRVERCHKRVRVMLGGEVVADSTRVLMVWEVPYYPTYFFPRVDVAEGALIERGDDRFDVVGGAQSRSGAARGLGGIDEVEGHVSFVWDEMGHWFEEDEEVFYHARNPATRVDVLRSSRPVRVEIDGVEVASSRSASFLFETGLPTRYYMPKTDVRFEHFSPTDTVSRCPYKGEARYWSARVNGREHRDVLWGYDAPLPESQGIAGLVCFYPEKVDLFVDGERI